MRAEPFARETDTLPLPRLVECGRGGGSSSFEGEGVAVLTDPALAKAASTVVAFSLRTGGCSPAPFASLNLGRRVEDEPANIERNQDRLLAALGLSHAREHLINPVQVHGDTLLAIAEDAPAREDALREECARRGAEHVLVAGIPQTPCLDVECDAVLTAEREVVALLCYADCVPVVIVAPGGAFAVVHSGWRGTYARIAGQAAQALSVLTGSPVGGFNAYIGPHICASCYEVSAEMARDFSTRFGSSCIAGERNLDMERAIVETLRAAGMRDERIASSGACTVEETRRFFSHRAENGRTGRFAAIGCRL